jgi:hypothetical protein
MKMSAYRLGLGFLLLAATPAFAQSRSTPVSKGAWLISGSAGFSRSHDDLTDQNQTNAGASPTALRFVASRFAIGGTLSASYSKSGSSKFTSYGIGPSARFFLGDTASRWLPFINASVFPQWSTSKSTIFVNGISTSITGDQTAIALDGSLGITRILVSHVGATGEAYYTRFNRSSNTNGTSRDYTVNIFGARFGLSVFLY